jgi:hypothetical protein
MTKNFKILAAASIVSFILLSSCTTTSPTSSSVGVPTARTFTLLKDNETLNLLDPDGETMRFTNFELSIETNIYLNVITRKTYTLSRSLNQFDLIKIDTEGYEFEVLKGATNLIKTAKYILIEMGENENLISWLRQREFYAVDILYTNMCSQNKLLDVLFEKDAGHKEINVY